MSAASSAASGSASVLLPTIYRSLLRLARQLDRAPLSKALLIAQPAQLFDMRSRALVKLPTLSGWSSALEAFNGGEFYAPASSAHLAVRDAFAQPPPADPVDVGLTALRSLGLAVAGGEQLAAEHAFECGAPSAVEQLSAVRAGSEVKPGSLLLTHPVSCLRQPTLHHAVILIISVDDDSVTGIIVNKPLDSNLGAAVTDDARDAIGDGLADLPLYKGGDVSERQLVLVHDLPGLSGSTPVVDGLFATSSFPEVRDALASSAVRAAVDQEFGSAAERADRAVEGASTLPPPSTPRVKCVAGFAGWAKEQLQAELERNVWFLAEADDVASLVMMEPPSAEGASDGWLRDTMWSGAMRQLGGEHVDLARFPGDHELVWEHMEQMWMRQSEELHKRIDMLEPKDKDRDG